MENVFYCLIIITHTCSWAGLILGKTMTRTAQNSNEDQFKQLHINLEKVLNPWPLIFWPAGKRFSSCLVCPVPPRNWKLKQSKCLFQSSFAGVFFLPHKRWGPIKQAPSIKVLNIQWPPLISDHGHLFAIPMTVFPLLSMLLRGHQALDRLSLALV